MRTMRLVVAALAAALIVGLTGPGPASAAPTCVPADKPVRVGIAWASGCYQPVTVDGVAGYRFEEPFRLNGWDVAPTAGAAVLMLPGDQAKRRQGVVRTVGGTVTLSAANARFGRMAFPGLRFDVAPPSRGSLTLTDSALAQPAPVVFSIIPLSVRQPLVLEEDGESSVELTFDLGGLLGQMLSKSERKLAFTLDMSVVNGTFQVDGGNGEVKDFDIAKDFFAIKELIVKVTKTELTVSFEGSFKLPRNGMSIKGGLTFDRRTWVPVSISFGFSGAEVQLGATPIYWQGLSFAFSWPPPLPPGAPQPPFIGSGDVEMSVGTKQKFFGSEVAPVLARAGMKIATRDDTKRLPGYFSLDGEIETFGLKTGSASFRYWFGGGASFEVSLGVSFPSGKNDPGAPNYFGGRVAGAFWNGGFNLEGSAKLKLLGVTLAGAEAVVSNYGIGGCLKLGLAMGGGIRWADGRAKGFIGWTCSLSEYRRQMPRLPATDARGYQAVADDDVTDVELAGRERVVKLVAAPGDDEAPYAVLIGEDGERIRSPHPDDPDGIVRREDGHAISDDDGTTVFVLPPESEGSWEIRELPGSSDVADVFVARATRPPVVAAEVTGSPRSPRRTLQWDAPDRPFQQLVFSEVLRNGQEVVLHRTKAASGSVRVRPTRVPDSWGKRTLRVQVLQRLATPRADLRLGRFRVTRPAAPDPVRRVTAQRREDVVRVAWPRARGARSYQVSARVVGYPLEHRDVVTGRRARLEVATVEPLRVRVTPLGELDRPGGSASVRLRARIR